MTTKSPRPTRITQLATCLLGLTLLLNGLGSTLAQQPLVISSGALLEEREGWSTPGLPLVERMADTGDGSWLAVWSYAPLSGAPLAGSGGRILARLVPMNPEGSPIPNPPMVPLVISNSSAVYNKLAAVRGTNGAWAVWQSPENLLAQWVSATTGQTVSTPLVLSAGLPPGKLHTASDGVTAWVAWGPSETNGSLQGVTLSSDQDAPRITGRFSISDFSRFGKGFALAARDGRALITEVGLGINHPMHTTRTFRIGPTGEAISGPEILAGVLPDLAENMWGVMNHGPGWMLVWSQQLTGVLPDRVVYGRVLNPDGTAGSEPLKALFVEPPGATFTRSLASAGDHGVLAVAYGYSNPTSAAAWLVKPGEDLQPRYFQNVSPIRPIPYPAPETGLGIGFDGTRVRLLCPQGDWPSATHSHFVQTLNFPLNDILPSQWPLSRGIGIQEEPALAWMPGHSVVAWQQISEANGTPDIYVRHRGADGQATSADVVLPRPDIGWLSSPTLASNGNRLLLVARHDRNESEWVAFANSDDVVGVFIENNQMVAPSFLIAGGLGSQRAARVAAWGDGFCVAWREEVRTSATETLYQIRCTFLTGDGTEITPGGLTVASSQVELAAPALATNGQSVGIAWRSDRGVEAASWLGSSPATVAKVVIFPAGIQPRSPDVIWDGQAFLITARVEYQNQRDGDAVGVAHLEVGSSQTTRFPDIKEDGREPTPVSLGRTGTAILWLDSRYDDSFNLYMATRQPDGTTSLPQRVMTGRFDRDTLVARGDGHGRIMVAVTSTSFGEEGVRVAVFAPGVTEVPALEMLATPSGVPTGDPVSFSFRWKPNILFPARLACVESSAGLDTWTAIQGASGVVALAPGVSPELAVFQSQPTAPAPRPPAWFYRLRPVLAE